ncbi:hypothetical protein Hena1_00590 [Erwinia phage Hena1]|uniref:Uncharacterized protein n=1 Tax=Erwinia phage Hena1 TaxID=2678601 RepID=A0A6B9J5S9_9CAUD|nr:hypothetical protein HWC84_gp058 [Erwinia phage Hena1]QGZ16235.1 hypothetical protein Hena1_00590 [Erwinia phage Hena1]
MANELPVLKFYYKNYRGEYGHRTVQDPKWRFGSTEYHKQPQWLIEAFDVEKQDFRTFAAADIVEIF